ncbi:MAG: hypothetical protein SFV54_24685 [Bryobacteraceae bacterium]|nr:hypothetical protein [Bryobacteraceae bacterium]
MLIQEEFKGQLRERAAAVERVLASRQFAQAGRLKQLLRFLADQALEGKEGLKETVIGVAVFGREPGYDPKTDGVVRSEVRRLRLKLQEYYAEDGAREGTRIEIPKGGYAVQFLETTPAPMEVREAKRGIRWAIPLAAAVAVVGLLAAGWGLARVAATLRKPADPRQLTNLVGQALHPHLSADGSLLVYSFAGGGDSGIYAMRFDGAAPPSPWRIPGTRARDFQPAVTRDGQRIAFLREEDPGKFVLLVQSLAGGDARPWATLERRDRMAWLPDGKRIVVSLRLRLDAPASLVVLDERGGRTPLTSPPKGVVHDGLPAISPDGRLVAFVRATEGSVDEIFTLPLDDNFETAGEPRQLTFEKRRAVGFCFAPDGAAVLASLQRGRSARGLWRIALDGRGEMERVPEAGINAVYPAAAFMGSKRVVYSVGVDDLNLYRVTEGEPAAISPSATLESSPAISPDGQWVAFRSARSGSSEIWVSRLDGSAPRRLTYVGGPVTGSPRWSPDGRYLVYDTRVDGNADIWTVGFGGGESRRVTADATNEVVPWWSRDGAHIYFASDRSGQWEIWKTHAEGGRGTVQVTKAGGFRAVESADGAWLYYSKREPGGGLWRQATAGGPEERVMKLEPSLWGAWAISARGVYRLENNASAAIVLEPAGGGPTQEVARLRGLPVMWEASLDAAANGGTVVFAQLDRAISDLFEIDLWR